MSHVAVYLPSLRGGGAERVMLTLAKAFAERGFRVDLVLARAEGPFLAEVPSTVRVVDLNSSGVLTSLPKLVRYLRRERPEALLSTLDHANLVALWARSLACVSLRMVIRAAINVGANTENSQNLRVRIIFRLARRFYRRADAVVAVSEGVANDLVQIVGIPRNKVHIIYNPVVTPEMLCKSRESLHDPWFAPGEPPVVLAVGRLSAQKDHSTLIRAFGLVRAVRPARLLILGEGEARSQLERLVAELGLMNDVRLPGFVDNPFKYMARAAVFVLSSRWEGLPNSLIQALALGMRVVSTDCPSGPREILRDGQYGTLVQVADSMGLARAILDLPKNQRVEASLQAITPFEIDAACSRYLSVLFKDQ